MKNKCINFYSLFFSLVLLLGFTSCETESIDQGLSSNSELNASSAKGGGGVVFDMNQECDYSVTDLYAGQNILVGNVTVEENGSDYIITYNITNNGYCISETHLSVVELPQYFPITKAGNPKIGHFEYSDTHECVSSYSYTVPQSEGTYIAAHAVVNCITESTSDNFIASLPSVAYACVTAKGGEGQDSYFDINISEGFLMGDYDAWCVDYDTELDNEDCFDADVFTTLDDLSSGPFEYPETFGAINWIINQDFISQGYNYASIQFAIWKLVEGEELYSGYYQPYDAAAVYRPGGLEIYNLAIEHLDYVPGCGENIGIILIPTNGKQSVIISKPIECNEQGECEETAWGAGCDFPGSSWATYFHYVSED